MVANFWQETARICKFYKYTPLFITGGFFRVQPLTLPRKSGEEDQHLLMVTHKELIIADGRFAVKFIDGEKYYDDTYPADMTVYKWIENEHVYVENVMQRNIKAFAYDADIIGREVQESAVRCGNMINALFAYWRTVKLADVPDLTYDKEQWKNNKPVEE